MQRWAHTPPTIAAPDDTTSTPSLFEPSDSGSEVDEDASQIVRGLSEIVVPLAPRLLEEGVGAQPELVGRLRPAGGGRDEAVTHLVKIPNVPDAIRRQQQQRPRAILADRGERQHAQLGLPCDAVTVREEIAQRTRHRDHLLLDKRLLRRARCARHAGELAKADLLLGDHDQGEAVVAAVLEHDLVLIGQSLRVEVELGVAVRVLAEDGKLLKVGAVVHKLHLARRHRAHPHILGQVGRRVLCHQLLALPHARSVAAQQHRRRVANGCDDGVLASKHDHDRHSGAAVDGVPLVDGLAVLVLVGRHPLQDVRRRLPALVQPKHRV
mmetsp:Transcript_20609/g.54191  ORF Transcript_20609/g.54191 Transcript_20609/m.54191 type:complete len:324 (-) Transcript_20609:983-1954(-)